MKTNWNQRLKTSKRLAFAAALLLPPINAEAAPGGVIHFGGEVLIEAAETGENARPGSVAIVAYNGGPLVVAGYDAPVYLKLDGMSGLGRQNPLLRDHDKKRIVGTIEATRVGNSIEASGRLVGKSEDRQEIEDLAADGFQWQASVGARPTKLVKIKAGNTTEVNGRKISGPAYIAVESRLAEVSLVTIGADADTSVHLAVAAEDAGGDSGDDAGSVVPPSDTLTQIKVEKERRRKIEAAAVKLIQNGANIEAIEAAMVDAVAGDVSPEQFELQILRNVARPQGRISSGGGNELRGRDLTQAIEASVLIELGESVSDLEKHYPERVLNAMDQNSNLRNGLSYIDAMLFVAEHNGQRLGRKDYQGMIRAAFPSVEAAGSSSTVSLSGIFSNIANKRMKAAFDSVESSWREVAEIESVRDFKTTTSYSLTGDMSYEKVGPDGELKHATVGEQSFTNQAETYGKMFGLNRTHMINDDIGALNSIPRRLGRGGALKLNDVFWTEFEENAGNFFHADNNNLIASGSSAPWYLLMDPMDLAMIQVVFLNGRQMPTVEQADADFNTLGVQFRGYHDFGVNKQEPRAAIKSPAALTIDSLEAAYNLALAQTDYDEKPLALDPKILLVSVGNFVTANNIYNSTEIVSGNTSKLPKNNPFAGMFRVVKSAYLTNS